MSATAVRPLESSISCARAKRAVALQRQRRRHRPRSTSAIAASTKMPLGARRPAVSIRPPGGARLAASIPASRIAALFAQPAWPSTRSSQTGRSRDHGVEIGGGREAAEAPALLVPAAADDPARASDWRRHMRRSARCASSSELGVAEIELQRAEAEAHDMAVGVDQAGDQGPAAAVEADIAAARAGGRRARAAASPCRRRRPACR